MQQKRLFFGIPMGSDLGLAFQDTMKKLKANADKKNIEVQWVPEENLHITLRFLGETPVDRISDLVGLVEPILSDTAGFSLKVQGLGAFPDDNHARVLWAGVQNKLALRHLQSAMDEAVLEWGGEEDAREFHPHLTVGRIRKTRSVRDLFSPFVRKKFGALSAKEVWLFESVQRRDFAPEYRPVHKFLLKPIEVEDEI
ncbi:MAG: RNA 2',3'-cyclic phosphodiesterase [Pseudobdellovibrionaceae bacterium]|nr:RNA 2',3'-cyclic phosphodiesterase [Bdellovibrionales bacterium]USN47912.1 MAG: RNA 2',3'-cyclic phosphodiesterase [Pseudobdellovibrionaceae bacterium]